MDSRVAGGIPTSALAIRVLGPLEADHGGGAVDLGGPRQRAVLAMLLIETNRVVSLDRLIDQLWQDEPPPTAIGSLQAYISNLRRVLEPDRRPRAPARLLVTQPPGYVLRVADDQVDAARFQQQLERARELLAAGHPVEAREGADQALALWRGDPFADMSFESFAQLEISRLRELRLVAEEVSCEATLRSGDPEAAVARLEPLVAAHPLREHLRELVALALYRAGRQADALRECERARAVLREELGVEPGPALTRLEAGILIHDAALQKEPSEPDRRPAADPATRPSTEPPADATGRPFVGRAGERELLSRAWRGARAGQTRAVVVTGEPGVGKTRLAEEAAEPAVSHGARVVWSRCYEDAGASSLWPWLSALRELLPEGAGDALTADVTAAQDEIADPGRARSARFQLLEGLVARWEAACTAGPVVLVLDDLQWADPGSVDLLELLVQQARRLPLLIVATVRTGEHASDQDPVTDLLARLARLDQVDRIDLEGLTVEDIKQYLAIQDTSTLGDGLAEQVHARTNGNAFFVVETLRLLASQKGDLSAVPSTVRDVVQRRMARLPGDTGTVLAVASVIGREFDFGLLRETCELGADHLVDLLEPALVSHLVVVDAGRPGTFRFAHPIVRDALYESMQSTRRARLHGKVAARLGATVTGPEDERIIEVAHHHAQTAVVGAGPGAAEAARDAARYETCHMDYEAAARWWQQALRLQELEGDQDRRVRFEFLVGLSRARWLAGDDGSSRKALAQALDLAEELGDVDLISEAPIRGEGFTPLRWRRIEDHDPRMIQALERALPRTADDPARHSRVLSQLALELCEAPGRADEALTRAAAGVEEARRSGEALRLARALQGLLLAIYWRPDHLDDQYAAAAELAQLDTADVPAEARLVGRFVATASRLTACDAAGFVDEVEDCWREAVTLRQPELEIPTALARVTAAVLEGDPDRAVERSEEVYRRFGRFGYPGAGDHHAGQLLEIGIQQGRHRAYGSRAGELFAQGIVPPPAVSIFMGSVAVAEGDRDGAAAALQALPVPLPEPHWTSLILLSNQAQLAALTTSPTCEAFYEALLPYAERAVVVAFGAVCRGSVHHFLGLLARVCRPEAAAGHFAAAVEANRRLGLHWWVEQSEAEASRAESWLQ